MSDASKLLRELMILIERHVSTVDVDKTSTDVDKTSTGRRQERREYQARWAREKRAKSKASGQGKAVTVHRERRQNVDSRRVDICKESPSHTLPQPDDSFLFEEMESEEKRRRSESARAREDRGSRMVPGMSLNEPARLMARQLGADDWQIEKWWPEFVDYWCAVPGQAGVKRDWPATWRNRVRKLLEVREEKNGRSLMEAGRRFINNPEEFKRRLAHETGADKVDYVPEYARVRLVEKG
jgi:hypothetical protein